MMQHFRQYSPNQTIFYPQSTDQDIAQADPVRIITALQLDKISAPHITPMDEEPDYMQTDVLGWRYEKDGKEYAHVGSEEHVGKSGYVPWILNIDMALNKGDVCHVDATRLTVSRDLKVLDVFTMNICGVERKVQHMYIEETTLYKFPAEDYWVEGIGSIYGEDLRKIGIRGTSVLNIYKSDYIHEVYDADGNKIFDRTEFESQLQELTGIEKVVEEGDEFDIKRNPLFDLNGRLVVKPQNGKIYLSKGRKILWQSH